MNQNTPIDDSELEMSTAHEWLREAINLQKIAGNPLDTNDIAMFEMFEREGWSHERRRAYILKRAQQRDTRKALYPHELPHDLKAELEKGYDSDE